jgi:hypothetical protein
MKPALRRTAAIAACMFVTASVPAIAQIFQASGYATISIAGLGATTTVAGDSRIPVLPRDVTFDPAQSHLHIRATGHRGVVRELDINVHGAHAGQRYELGANTGATLHVRMDQGAELTAESGHGFVSIEAIDASHVVGGYEGTFRNATGPVVIRGRFEANFGHTTGAGAAHDAGR